jgi:prepilin peptidase CpaA
MPSTEVLVALIVCAAACVTDVRSRRIPNALTFGAAATALLFHTVVGGPEAGLRSAAGWLVGCALFLPFFLLRGMGGGDVKLLAALGAWLGPSSALPLAVYTSIAGGVLGLGVAATRGYLTQTVRNLRTLLTFWWLAGPRPLASVSLDAQATTPRLAYAIPISIGTMVTLWLR